MRTSTRHQESHLYSAFYAPRGFVRMAELGYSIAQQYLTPFDNLIGVIGDAGSGKSIVIKGMFPGLELTNDDEGINVRPLPILDLDDTGFFSPHTYHMDIRFELGFTQMHELVDAIKYALKMGKRVIVEHFDLIYEALGFNADLIIGVGEEIIVTRPSIFGPEPKLIYDVVYKSIKYRKMAHTAEDLCEFCLKDYGVTDYEHGDVNHGFTMNFIEKPTFNIKRLEEDVRRLIAADLPIAYVDQNHIRIGDDLHYCTGPRMQLKSTGGIEKFMLLWEFLYDKLAERYLLVGSVGRDDVENFKGYNLLNLDD